MKGIKVMSLRIPKEMWTFLKLKSLDQEMPINEIINRRLNIYKRKCQKKLTARDTMVS